MGGEREANLASTDDCRRRNLIGGGGWRTTTLEESEGKILARTFVVEDNGFHGPYALFSPVFLLRFAWRVR